MSTPAVSVAFHVEPPACRGRCSTPLCRNERRVGGRDCLDCHARWMRENRPRHSEMPAERRQRLNCRAYVNVLIRRGALKRRPCAGRCGLPAGKNVRPRHDDYSKPKAVSRWTCDACEREHRHPQDQTKAS